MTSRHISSAQMIDLIEGRLALADQVEAQSHAAACARCAAEVARLTRVIELMRADTCEDPPDSVTAQAVALFRTRSLPKPPSWRQRLVAELRFDSGRLPQPLGVRAGAQSVQQLLFSAGDAGLNLHITQAGELWSITGQVLGPDVNGLIDLEGAGGLAQAALNQLGEFQLPPVPSGTYTLTARLENVDVEVVELKVGV